MAKFKDSLHQEARQEFLAIMVEGKEVASAPLQAALDTGSLAARLMVLAVSTWCSLRLKSLGLSHELQHLVQDLLFKGNALFSEQTDTKLHGLKDLSHSVLLGPIHAAGLTEALLATATTS